MTHFLKTTQRRGRSGAFYLPERYGADKARVYGQFFTPQSMVERMVALRRNHTTTLEPACGSGAFSDYLRTFDTGPVTAIEVDIAHAPAYALVMDFFAYPTFNKFGSVIGNPPYVSWKDMPSHVKDTLHRTLDTDMLRSANLYLWFIYKAVLHLEPGGELIFIVPRDMPQATSAAKLNQWLYENGTITDFWETGDEKVFSDATPPCCVFRYEKGRIWDRRMNDGRIFGCYRGILTFTKQHQDGLRLSSLFRVSVGGVSGADELFRHPMATTEVVGSGTHSTGRTTRMAMGNEARALLRGNKDKLLKRGIKEFTEDNWWHWGRNCPQSTDPRIYVVAKTRSPAPFFTHSSLVYNGSILALFPRDSTMRLREATSILNRVDWGELGFRAGGRLMFTQRTLENALLSKETVEALQRLCASHTSLPKRRRRIQT